MREISQEDPRFGYRRAWAIVRGEGFTANRKRVQRLWREEGLRVPMQRVKRRRLGSSTVAAARLVAAHRNHVWALDFLFDPPATGCHQGVEHVRRVTPASPWKSWGRGRSSTTMPDRVAAQSLPNGRLAYPARASQAEQEGSVPGHVRHRGHTNPSCPRALPCGPPLLLDRQSV
ncbi:MAG: transposase [Candidatus Dormibacteraeota bacterium]|nr:transposase [Candidatus Dormibacteraeota bacterium]